MTDSQNAIARAITGTDANDVTSALYAIAQAIRSLARAVRGEQDQAGRESGR